MKLKLVFKTLMLLFCIFASSNMMAQNTFIIDNIRYSYDSNTSTASVIANNYTGNILIPAAVTDNGIQYSVTSIAKSAFLNCTGLATIILPESLTIIGDSAFYGCTGLYSITSYNPEPPGVGDNTFSQIDFSACDIIIKVGSLQKYLAAPGWKNFPFYQETIPTGLDIPENNNVKVYTVADFAVIKGANLGENINVYSEHGIQINSIMVQNEFVKIKLPANQIYVIQIENKSYKVIPFV